MDEKDEKKKESPMKEITDSFKEIPSFFKAVRSELPNSPPESTFASSISPSTEAPADRIPTDPVIPIGKDDLPPPDATAVEKMVMDMANSNLQTPEEQELSKVRNSKLAAFEAKIRRPSSPILDKSTETENSVLDKRKQREPVKKKTGTDMNTLFPGLKAIGDALGLSKKEKEQDEDSETPKK